MSAFRTRTRTTANDPPRGTDRRRVSGFSLIELLLTVVVSTTGFVALFGMQTATMRGMANARHIVEATNLAENFVEKLRVEFSQWTTLPGQGLDGGGDFPHLADLPVGAAAVAGAQTPGSGLAGAPGWVIGELTEGEDRRVSVAGPNQPAGWTSGANGALVDPGFEDDQKPYCLHYRLTWLLANSVIRAEVEASWPIDGADMDQFVQCETLASANLGTVRSVTMTTTLTINTFLR